MLSLSSVSLLHWYISSRALQSRLGRYFMPNLNRAVIVQRKTVLIAAIEKMLPDFAKACRAPEPQAVIMHQDAFAADYQEEEYRLIGMAIKFAGLCGKEISIHGTNRETVDQQITTH